MNDKPKLTVKEAKLVKGIVEGKTRQAAAMEAYDVEKPTTASAIATETLKKPRVQEALAIAFAENGITLDSVIKPIADGLKATKTGMGDIKEQNRTEELIPDHSIRLKAASMAHGLMGLTKQAGDVNITYIDSSRVQRDTYEIE